MRWATGEALAPLPGAWCAAADRRWPGCPRAEPMARSSARTRCASALGLIRAITCPTVTVSPSSARISVIVPSAGAGSSMSTLSVEISTTVSPSLTVSPTLTDHSRIVPSVTDSPPVGVTMSITPTSSGASAAAWPSASVAAASGISSCAGQRRRLGGRVADSPVGGWRGRAGARRRCRRAIVVAISASSAPTATVSPSAAWMRTIVPATGEGTSASTLSVEISTSVSSTAIESPSCLCHSSTVPSATESPMAGITTWIVLASTAISFNCNACESAQMRPARRRGGVRRPRRRSSRQTDPRPPEHGHRHREPERDDPHPRGDDADQRHRDPHQPVRESEDERLGLRVSGRERAHQQGQVHGRVGEGRDLQPTEGDHAHLAHPAASSEAIRRSGSSASAGHWSTSAGHQANSSCS